MVNNQLNGIGSSRPVAEVEVEEIEDDIEDDVVTPPAASAPVYVLPPEINFTTDSAKPARPTLNTSEQKPNSRFFCQTSRAGKQRPCE